MSWAFLATTLIVVATPGTGVILTIAAGLRRGPRQGLVAAFGCTLGIIPHLVASIAGAAALLRAGGEAFETLKILGVGYLLVMAWSMWRDTGTWAPRPGEAPASAARTIISAILANLLNPKLTLFFFAFLPQFVPPRASHPLAEMLGDSAVFMALTFVVFGAYGVFAGVARTQLIQRPALVRRLRRTFSLLLLGLAGRLATTNR